MQSWKSSLVLPMSCLNRTMQGVRIQKLGLRDLAASLCVKPPSRAHNHIPLAV
ncbi:hypothetical protein V8C42DRAFT_308018 [Trichoderma barbatum]